MFATVFAHRGKWHVRLNCQAQPLLSRCPAVVQEPVGIDRGLSTFAVAATADGQHVQTLTSPRPLARRLRRLRRLSRAHSRKQKGSRNRRKHAVKLGKFHGRIRDIRHDFLHRASTDLVNNHAHVVLEDLNTSGLMRNRCLARAIADSGWAMFAKNVMYKAQWRGRTVTVADRFYPSTKRCSVCGSIAAAVPLRVRQFTCAACGNRLDRDLNAARNLAQWPQHVAGKPPETQNACEGRSAGQMSHQTLVKLLPSRQEREKSRAPEKGGVGEIVNTL
jgi:putative transposase